MSEAPSIPLSGYRRYEDAEMLARARRFCEELSRRRSVRQFSTEPVPRGVVEQCLGAAASAPSGANLQPWHFVVVSEPGLKSRIRAAAEAEERSFYEKRAPEDWLEVLRPLGTDAVKPYLETAPYLIAIFSQPYRRLADGSKQKHYYASESTGIATGFLIAALHHAGLATLTHTPSPMGFLNRLLERPAYERAFLLLVTGRPAADAHVPDIRRKSLDEVVTFR